jgi:hypothetical protein
MRLSTRSWIGVLFCSVAFAQAPLLTPQRFLAGDLALASSLGDQRSPSLSAGGGAVLAAWSDARAFMYGGDDQGESYSDIWIQMLGSQSEPSWPTPRRISASPERDVWPRATWNGSSWLVSWVRQPLTASNTFSRVLAVRVDANGTVLDPQPLVLFSGTFFGHSATSDGQDWLVIAKPTSGGGRARTVSTSAVNPLGPDVQVTAWGTQTGDAAFAQGAYLITSGELGPSGTFDIVGQRFDSNLNAVDPATFPIVATAQSEGAPLVASNGSEFLFAWSTFDIHAWTGAMHCARVSSSGALLSQHSLTSSMVGGIDPTDIAWDGVQWFVGSTAATLTRVSATGQVRDFNGFSIRPPDSVWRSGLSITEASGGGVHASWMQSVPVHLLSGNPRYEVRSSRIVSPANLGLEHVPGPGAPAQSAPAVAAGVESNAVLLRSENGASARLRFARVDSNGAPLDSEPVLVASASDIRHPTLAWDGQRYLAVWIHSEPFPAGATIRARRIAANGTLLDAADLVLGVPSPGTWPDVDVAGRNGEFAVVGLRLNDVSVWRIRGSDGSVLSGPIRVAPADARRVSICATPNGFAAGWSRYVGSGGEIAGCLLDPQTVPSAPFVIAGVVAGEYYGALSVATSGGELLYAFDLGLSHQFDRAILARRYDPSGAALDAAPFPVAATPGREQFFPDLTWDGAHYVCAYQELIGRIQSNVRVARIATSGAVLDPQGLAVEATSISEGQPAAVGLGAGRTLVASSILRVEAPLAAYRVALRTVIDGCPALTTYCTAKPNSQQCLPAIAAIGMPSASGAGTCTVTAVNLLNGTNGLLLYGYQAGITPFHGGFLCIAPPRRRTPPQNAGAIGSSNPCDGQFAFDLNAYIATGLDPALQAPGQPFACQFWSRDPGDAFGSGLTDALHGVVCW